MTQQRRNPLGKKKKYWLEITEDAKHQLERLPGYLRQRIKGIISALADEPRPAFALLMRGTPERYRIAVDTWRIVYRVDEDVLIVEVLKVGQKHGPEFYADLE
jgi:mRNA interferase RelE/StbE